MSTSAEFSPERGGDARAAAERAAGPDGFVLSQARLDDPDIVALIEQVQGEYVVRYGGPDEAPIDPQEFDPPSGRFLLGCEDGRPVAMGGWRIVGPGRAELRRMFVVAPARGRGLARRLLITLEDDARAAGVRELVLNTGVEQPEAVALYRGHGYVDVAPFGHYATAPGAIFLGKSLTGGTRPG
ncbi:MAG: GNAT family N-acetyltransferase [bacterium]